MHAWPAQLNPSDSFLNRVFAYLTTCVVVSIIVWISIALHMVYYLRLFKGNCSQVYISDHRLMVKIQMKYGCDLMQTYVHSSMQTHRIVNVRVLSTYNYFSGIVMKRYNYASRLTSHESYTNGEYCIECNV